MRLLLAKKRGSAAPRRFHSRAELECSRSPRLEKWLDHGCRRTKPRFSQFYLVSKHFGRSRARSPWHQRLAHVRLSTIQSTCLYLFRSFALSLSLRFCLQLSSSEMTGIAKWFTRCSYVFLCVSNLCITTERKFSRTKADDVPEAKFLPSFCRVQYLYFNLCSIF